MIRSMLFAGLAAAALAGCAPAMTFTAQLTGTQEVPPTRSSGTGTATATFYADTRALTYTVEYAGLSGPATAAHFHGPAAYGANAPVVVPFATAASPIKGGVTLTEAQKADLIAGLWYANVHTAMNPGGEIRGQMQRTR